MGSSPWSLSLVLTLAAQLNHWESQWTEPLTDYAHFGSIIKKLLLYRHQKNVQHEMTADAIEHKKASLEQLEKAELEARRLEGALAAAGVPGRRNGSEANDGALPSDPNGSTASVRRSTSSSTGGGSGGYGFLSALSHSLTGMIDVHPEETRRNNISKTRDQIAQVCLPLSRPSCSGHGTDDPDLKLEDALVLSAQDVKYASQMIQADLDRFQRQKVADIRSMTIALATAHRDWCKQVRLPSLPRAGAQATN